VTAITSTLRRDGWYILPYDVAFRDLDAFGHVNNATFFTFFEMARTRLWFELNGGAKFGDINFIVAHAQCDFRRQVALEPIEIAVRIGELRNSSLDFHYEIRKIDDGALAATGKVVVVLFDWTANARTQIDDALRARIAEFQRDANTDSTRHAR
jgi:acyl-CoA thioester hydrolase